MSGDGRTAPGKEYVCALCKGKFEGTRTHEECVAEQETITGEEYVREESHVVCTPCWVRIMRANGIYVPGDGND